MKCAIQTVRENPPVNSSEGALSPKAKKKGLSRFPWPKKRVGRSAKNEQSMSDHIAIYLRPIKNNNTVFNEFK